MNNFFCLGLAYLINKSKTKTRTWLIYKQTNMKEFFIESSLSCSRMAWFVYRPNLEIISHRYIYIYIKIYFKRMQYIIFFPFPYYCPLRLTSAIGGSLTILLAKLTVWRLRLAPMCFGIVKRHLDFSWYPWGLLPWVCRPTVAPKICSACGQWTLELDIVTVWHRGTQAHQGTQVQIGPWSQAWYGSRMWHQDAQMRIGPWA